MLGINDQHQNLYERTHLWIVKIGRLIKYIIWWVCQGEWMFVYSSQYLGQDRSRPCWYLNDFATVSNFLHAICTQMMLKTKNIVKFLYPSCLKKKCEIVVIDTGDVKMDVMRPLAITSCHKWHGLWSSCHVTSDMVAPHRVTFGCDTERMLYTIRFSFTTSPKKVECTSMINV